MKLDIVVPSYFSDKVRENTWESQVKPKKVAPKASISKYTWKPMPEKIQIGIKEDVLEQVNSIQKALRIIWFKRHPDSMGFREYETSREVWDLVWNTKADAVLCLLDKNLGATDKQVDQVERETDGTIVEYLDITDFRKDKKQFAFDLKKILETIDSEYTQVLRA